MKIAYLKLFNGGVKGMETGFLEEKVKDGYTFPVLTKQYPKYPIHIGLEKGILELRKHALEFSGCFRIASNDVEKKFLAENVSITKIIFVEDGFKFEYKFDANGKSTVIKTDEITSADGYAQFDEVSDILERIKEETESYLKGNKKVSDIEMATMFAKQDKQITMDFVNGLDEAELKEFCTKTLIGMKCVVASIEEEETEEELDEAM